MTDKKAGHGIEAGIIKSVYAGIPASCIGKDTSIFQGLIRPVYAI
jgi:hypothetical protein